MGDNRENSMDSRYFGSIKRDSILSIGALKVFPFNNIELLK